MDHEGGYYDEALGGVAEWDQLHARAMEQLRSADSFVLVTGQPPFPEDDDSDMIGMNLIVVSAVRTPFAPAFLTQATYLAAGLPLKAMNELFEQSDESA